MSVKGSCLCGGISLHRARHRAEPAGCGGSVLAFTSPGAVGCVVETAGRAYSVWRPESGRG